MEQLYDTIACLTNSLSSNKDKIKSLRKEINVLREETPSTSTWKSQEQVSSQVKKLEEKKHP